MCVVYGYVVCGLCVYGCVQCDCGVCMTCVFVLSVYVWCINSGVCVILCVSGECVCGVCAWCVCLKCVCVCETCVFLGCVYVLCLLCIRGSCV